MAEIKIEKKKPIWPWIILVLIILAILYFLVFADDADNDDMEMDDTEQLQEEDVWEDEDEMTTWEEESDTTSWETATTDTLGGSQDVSGYLTYISDKAKMGVDHQYTNNALIHLMNAVQAKANEIDYNIDADMQSVRQDANAIQQDPTSEKHAEKIKQAGTKLANILEKMQKDNYPDLSKDVQEMKTAANNIDGSMQTLQQKDQINKFFDEAADVLRKMS